MRSLNFLITLNCIQYSDTISFVIQFMQFCVQMIASIKIPWADKFIFKLI